MGTGSRTSRLTAAGVGRPAALWIVSPVWDSLLFIGAPLVAIAAFLPLRGWFSSQQIAVFLLAFFTFGHHLPGFLRAYGDSDLFRRFRWRFLAAPPAVFATALWFDARELHGLLIFVAAWDVWHVLMQHYGFLRIYDAKAGVTSHGLARLDLAMALTWYVGLIAASPDYRHGLMSRAYAAGVPVIPPMAFDWLLGVLTTGVAVVTLLYAGVHLKRWRDGAPVSLRKLAGMVVFVGSTYYLYVYLDDFLVGFTVWSAFHCIQYYGIVWVFNCRRVRAGASMAGFARKLFRPSPGLAALYLALIFAYGSINFGAGLVPDDLLRRLLLAFVLTSSVLHYYFDGFIWRVREPEVGRPLQIRSRPGLRIPVSAYSRKWQPLALGLLLAVLGILEVASPPDTLAATSALADISPRLGAARFDLGRALAARGRYAEAAAEFDAAAERMRDPSAAFHNRGSALLEAGRPRAAAVAYRAALDTVQTRRDNSRFESASPLLPGVSEGRSIRSAEIRNHLGDALARSGDRDLAIEEFEQALALDPEYVEARVNLGATLAEAGRFEDALGHLEAAVRTAPEFGGARLNLAALLAGLGQWQEALGHYRRVLTSPEPAERDAAAAAIAEIRAMRGL